MHPGKVSLSSSKTSVRVKFAGVGPACACCWLPGAADISKRQDRCMGNLPEFGQLNAQDWNRLQDAASRFEQAWQEGQPPELSDFLPAAEDRLRPLLLRELIKTDLEMRVRRTADVVRLEEYCERFQELGAPSTLPASLIYEEYRVRQRYGDKPDLESFRERFPV